MPIIPPHDLAASLAARTGSPESEKLGICVQAKTRAVGVTEETTTDWGV